MHGTAALTVATLLLASDLPMTGRIMSGTDNRVELTNTGSLAITAWTFAVVTPTATGTHREVHSADVYLSEVTRGLPQSNEHLDWLRPGQSRALPVDAAPAGATVHIVAVVLEDGTGLGEPETVAAFFAHRAAERDELKKVVDTFNAVLQTTHGVAAFEELQHRFASTAGAEESVPHRSAREAVDAWLQKAKAGNADDVERSARSYVAFVTRQHEVAQKHATRRGG
jgi:hypothetical protein